MNNKTKCVLAWLSILLLACSGDSSTVLDAQSIDASVCSDCEHDCEADGADLVYVLDRTEVLLTFDLSAAEAGNDPFTVLGSLRCSTGDPLPGIGSIYPYSMTSDRKGNIWIFYTSGELFKVDVATRSCTKTSWDGPTGMDVILMAFAGSNSQPERLFMEVSPIDGLSPARYTEVDLVTLTMGATYPLPASEGFVPSLAGTSDGQMLSYVPELDKDEGTLASLDLTTGMPLETWPIPDHGTNVVSFWSFAVHGGTAIFFTTAIGIAGRRKDRIVSFDPSKPASDQLTIIDADSSREIILAAVSTCAPPWSE